MFPTLSSPLTSCAPSQYGSTRVTIPAPGTENDDKNPPRIAPRHLFDLAVGDDNLFRGDKQITRLTYGQGRPAIDFARLVELYQTGRLMLDQLITLRLPLAQINEGFARMLAGDVIRAVVTF